MMRPHRTTKNPQGHFPRQKMPARGSCHRRRRRRLLTSHHVLYRRRGGGEPFINLLYLGGDRFLSVEVKNLRWSAITGTLKRCSHDPISRGGEREGSIFEPQFLHRVSQGDSSSPHSTYQVIIPNSASFLRQSPTSLPFAGRGFDETSPFLFCNMKGNGRIVEFLTFACRREGAN